MLIFIGIKGPTFTQFSYNTKLLGRGIQKNKIYVLNFKNVYSNKLCYKKSYDEVIIGEKDCEIKLHCTNTNRVSF